MINKAIAKITREMMAANDPLVNMIEEHLTSVCINEKVASKLLFDDKTIKGASKIIWAEASKRKQGNGSHIPDAECFKMAEEYFGITDEDKRGTTQHSSAGVIDITNFL